MTRAIEGLALLVGLVLTLAAAIAIATWIGNLIIGLAIVILAGLIALLGLNVFEILRSRDRSQ